MKRLVNNINLEDCFSFIPKILDNSVDLAIIDPPYNMKKGNWDNFPDESSFLEFTQKWIELIIPKITKTGSIYIFNSPYNCAFILNILIEQDAIFQNWITWNKQDGIGAARKKYSCRQETILFFTKSKGYYFNSDVIREPYKSEGRIKHAQNKGILKNGKRWFPNEKGALCGDVWNFSSYRHNNKINGKVVKPSHPTPKPEALIERIILASSTPDSLVLDLFSGSGTTAAMCIKHKRNFIGCESASIFHSHITQRIKNAHSKYTI